MNAPRFTLRRNGRVNETVGITEPPRPDRRLCNNRIIGTLSDHYDFPRCYVPAFATVESARHVSRWLPRDGRLPSGTLTLDRAGSIVHDVTQNIDRTLALNGRSRMDVLLLRSNETADAPIFIRTGTLLCVRKSVDMLPFQDEEDDVYEPHEVSMDFALLMPFVQNVGLLLPGILVDEDDDEIRIQCQEVLSWRVPKCCPE